MADRRDAQSGSNSAASAFEVRTETVWGGSLRRIACATEMQRRCSGGADSCLFRWDDRAGRVPHLRLQGRRWGILFFAALLELRGRLPCKLCALLSAYLGPVMFVSAPVSVALPTPPPRPMKMQFAFTVLPGPDESGTVLARVQVNEGSSVPLNN